MGEGFSVCFLANKSSLFTTSAVAVLSNLLKMNNEFPDTDMEIKLEELKTKYLGQRHQVFKSPFQKNSYLNVWDIKINSLLAIISN